MIDDAATLDGESAIPLEGVALGVDHLEALVVFFLQAPQSFARWARTGASVSANDVTTAAREAYLAAAAASSKIDPAAAQRREAGPRPVYPIVTIDDPSHLVIVQRVRSFGIAAVFEREAPLGLARAFAQKIVATLEHELPFSAEPKVMAPPVVVPVASVRGPSVAPPPMPRPQASARPSPPPPSPHGSTEARTLVSQVSPVLPAPPARVSAPPMAEAPDALASAQTPAPPPPPRIVSAPPPEPDVGPDTGRTPPPERAPVDRYGNGPDTIARPRAAPTAEEIAAVLGQGAVALRTSAASEPPARDAPTSDRDEPPNSTAGRARRLVSLLEDKSIEPHLVRTRLGLRTGLGVEALLDPRALSTEAIVLLETAAEDMLGVDHDGLVALLRSGAEGTSS